MDYVSPKMAFAFDVWNLAQAGLVTITLADLDNMDVEEYLYFQGFAEGMSEDMKKQDAQRRMEHGRRR